MELYVGSDGFHHYTNASVYTIEPVRRRPNGRRGPVFYRSDIERLKTLAPRIERMTRRRLGKHFKHLLVRPMMADGTVALAVQKGTSEDPKVKFELRKLLGWISLMDVEPGAAKA